MRHALFALLMLSGLIAFPAYGNTSPMTTIEVDGRTYAVQLPGVDYLPVGSELRVGRTCITTTQRWYRTDVCSWPSVVRATAQGWESAVGGESSQRLPRMEVVSLIFGSMLMLISLGVMLIARDSKHFIPKLLGIATVAVVIAPAFTIAAAIVVSTAQHIVTAIILTAIALATLNVLSDFTKKWQWRKVVGLQLAFLAVTAVSLGVMYYQ